MSFLPRIEDGIRRQTCSDRDTRISSTLNKYYEHREDENVSLMLACLDRLNSHLGSDSLLSWYRDHDLKSCKTYAFNAAMAHRLKCQLKPAKDGLAKVMDPLFFALLSGHKGLISWYSQYRLPLYIEIREPMPRHENVNRYEYFSLQVLLALSGEWDLLKKRSESYLAAPPSKWQRKQDYRFFIALADGDVVGMEAALNSLFDGRVIRNRIDDVWGLQKEFIYSWVFIYLKIALIHGYNLNVDSPWVPQELLSLDQLPNYECFFGLWDDSLIFREFEDDPSSWCKNASVFSPVPNGRRWDSP